MEFLIKEVIMLLHGLYFLHVLVSLLDISISLTDGHLKLNTNPKTFAPFPHKLSLFSIIVNKTYTFPTTSNYVYNLSGVIFFLSLLFYIWFNGMEFL